MISPSAAGSINAQLEGIADAKAEELKFFHWPLEFPDVYEKGGFDVIIGNPPWEKIKLQEKEFFSTRDEKIANATNKAKRNKLINRLRETNPKLYEEYLAALNYSEASGKFIRGSGRLPEIPPLGEFKTACLQDAGNLSNNIAGSFDRIPSRGIFDRSFNVGQMRNQVLFRDMHQLRQFPNG